jgi:hypothetical protein
VGLVSHLAIRMHPDSHTIKYGSWKVYNTVRPRLEVRSRL